MKGVKLLLIFILTSFVLHSQEVSDSTYQRFTKCVYDFFITKFKKKDKDSLIVFFEDTPIAFKTSYQEGGIYHSLFKLQPKDSAIVDTSYSSRKIFFDRKTQFSQFLNFIISTPHRDKPQLSKLTGIWAYVYVPAEEWQQFFIDQMLGYDTTFINPAIDIFSFEKNIVVHSRYKLNCLYSNKVGFVIHKTLNLRIRKIPKKN